MTDELYDLYKRDTDFKEYVDRWCKAHNLSFDEVLNLSLIKEYAKLLKEAKR